MNSKVGSSSYTRDFTEGEKIGLPEENVPQVSSKHNEYKVSLHLESGSSQVSFTFI